MKLVNSNYNLEIEFIENRTISLIFEDANSMRDIISDLWNQANGEEGKFVLSEGNKELKIEKYFDMVINPFDINLNNKKIQNALYNSLENSAEEFLQEKDNVNSMIINLLDKVVATESLACFEYNLELNWKDLFKIYNVSIDETYSTALEIILEYLKIISTFLGVKVITFVGLDMYFDKSELEVIVSQSNYSKLHLILISSHESYEINGSDIFIIDKDRCIIRRRT